MDTTWPYRVVADYLNYILQRLNIQPQGSSVTLLCGADAAIMVNTTHYLTDFYAKWNMTTHARFSTGFYLPRLLSGIRDLVELRLMQEIDKFSSGGSSLVALLMPNPLATITDADLEYSIRFWSTLTRTMPDLQFLYYAGGAVVRFQQLVVNPNTDLFPLAAIALVEEASQPVAERIRRIPRRLSNPRCSIAWETHSVGHNRLLQNLRPGGITFYRLLPNYFFGSDHSDEPRALSVQAVNPVTFTVCTSRSMMWPSMSVGSSSPSSSSSSRGVRRCSQIVRNTFTLDLSHACRDYGASSLTDCPPVFVSVQAQSFVGGAEQNACTQPECRTPDEVTYAMQLQSMSCHAGGGRKYRLSAAGIVLLMALAIPPLL